MIQTRCSHSVSLRLHPNGLSHATNIDSLAHSSIGTPSRIKSSSTICRHTVSGLFHRPLGLLFTFPSRYLFTIGLLEYLALPVSTGRFTQAIHVLSYSRTMTIETFYFRIRDCYRLGFSLPEDSTNKTFCNSTRVNTTSSSYNPPYTSTRGLGCFLFARRY